MMTQTIPQTLSPEKQQLKQLVLAAQAGQRDAFDQLFTRFERAVYGSVYQRVRNDAEAQELVQDVFIQAMRKIDQLSDPLCFGGWLRSIAVRMAINRVVRSRPTVALTADWVESDQTDSPLNQALARERGVQVRLGLKRLNDLDRDTLEAFYFRGRSLLQMSDEFESPVGTIKRRLHVARKRLAKELATLAPAG